jgi:hypothetical protein
MAIAADRKARDNAQRGSKLAQFMERAMAELFGVDIDG